MSLLDPADRTARGIAIAEKLTGAPLPAPATPYEESWRDFIFAEVFNRPGLDLRARFLIAIAGSAMTYGAADQLEGFVLGALRSGTLSLAELREAALHFSVYAGWTKGAEVDKAITRVAEKLGLPPVRQPPIRAAAWDPAVRDRQGEQEFINVMTFPGGPPATPYLEAIRNFVFGEMWCRPGLDQRSRRWITLVGVCESCAEIPISSHIHSAMSSGNCTPDELQEFVLQYGVHAGWPRASQVQSVVIAMSKKIAAGLPYHG
ncbi:carboxymuconolactone decarboxylase family protein [Acidocella sp.]|uniref:carboxymuconolactone decarboxylase family protein n=1 Tax=Acidocella sp. TaxID=50710 RepID=UPI0026032162|nr:carboxymuconolactone decarboxylase family protein [Acidocella sp.]